MKHLSIPTRSQRIGWMDIAAMIAVVISLFILGAISASGQATKTGATLEIVPQSVEFPALGAAHALLVLRNSTADTLSNISITAVTVPDIGITSNVPLNSARRLSPSGDLAWDLVITDSAYSVTSETIILSARFQQVAAGKKNTGIPRVLHVTLPLKRRDIKELVDMKIETTLDALDDRHTGIIYLVLTNKSNRTVKVTSITPSIPGFIKIRSDSIAAMLDSITFPPRQTGTIAIPVETQGRVQPGKHLLLFNVSLAWDNSHGGGSWNTVVQREVTVGVFGESVLLSIVGVPTFLLMPGVLILVFWNLLWTKRFLRGRRGTDEFPINIDPQDSKLTFGVVSTTISIVVVGLYVSVHQDQDILTVYGLPDLVRLWFFSIAVFGFFGYMVIVRAWRYYQDRRTYMTRDNALSTLEKMGRQGHTVRCETRTLTLTGGSGDVFLLENIEEGMDRVWVAPIMWIDWKFDGQGNHLSSQKARESIAQELEPTSLGDASSIAVILRHEGSNVDVRFKQDGIISHPINVPLTALTDAGDKALIIDLA